MGMVASNITQQPADCKRDSHRLIYTKKCLFCSEEWEKPEPCATVDTTLISVGNCRGEDGRC